MDTKVLNQQSQHWEKNFSSKPEMFGLEPSLPAKKSLKFFQEKKINKIVELGAGLGRDTIFFAKNSIHVNALDYSSSGIKIINEKAEKQNLSKYIPLRRLGESEEIGALLVYLASEFSDFVTGQTIFVDGGAVSHA